jgi:hypothetical protein
MSDEQIKVRSIPLGNAGDADAEAIRARAWAEVAKAGEIVDVISASVVSRPGSSERRLVIIYTEKLPAKE